MYTLFKNVCVRISIHEVSEIFKASLIYLTHTYINTYIHRVHKHQNKKFFIGNLSFILVLYNFLVSKRRNMLRR